MKLFAHSNGTDYEFDLRADGDRLTLLYKGREIEVVLDEHTSSIRTAFVGHRRIDFGWDRQEGTYSIQIDGIEYPVEVRDPRTERLAQATQGGAKPGGIAEARAPIPGLITKVLRRPGEAVHKDQPVLCLDAMKLENEIGAPRDGVVKSIHVQSGQSVEKGQVLFVVE